MNIRNFLFIVVFVGMVLFLINYFKSSPDSLSSIIPIQSKNLSSFVPNGWHVLFKKQIQISYKPEESYVFIIEEKKNRDNRILFIVNQNKRGMYRLQVANSNAVYGPSDSGRMGDVIVDLITQRGSFTIVHYHGGNWNHGNEITFSWKNAQWVLSDSRECSVSDFSPPNVKVQIYYAKLGKKLQNFNIYEKVDVIFEKIVESENLWKYMLFVECGT